MTMSKTKFNLRKICEFFSDKIFSNNLVFFFSKKFISDKKVFFKENFPPPNKKKQLSEKFFVRNKFLSKKILRFFLRLNFVPDYILQLYFVCNHLIILNSHTHLPTTYLNIASWQPWTPCIGFEFCITAT